LRTAARFICARAANDAVAITVAHSIVIAVAVTSAEERCCAKKRGRARCEEDERATGLGHKKG
jgi:hypothetical protein